MIAALILSLVWYAGVVLLFYREKFNDLLSGRRAAMAPEPLRHEWDEELEERPLIEEDNLMGKSVLPEGMSRLSMDQFGFAPKAVPEAEDKGTRLGLVPDELEELKSIFHILERDKGGKAEFISLFGLVSAKYSKLKGTPDQRAIND